MHKEPWPRLLAQWQVLAMTFDNLPQGTCPKALPCVSATYERTNGLTKTLSHLYIYPSPFVTHTRVQKTGIVGVWDRAGYAQLSGVAA